MRNWNCKEQNLGYVSKSWRDKNREVGMVDITADRHDSCVDDSVTEMQIFTCINVNGT